jgi:hypothetical protein
MPGHLNHSELWVPLSLQPEEFTAGSAASWTFRMVGRLKPGVTAAQAQSDAQRVAQETMRNYPAFMRSLRIRSVVTPLHEDTVEQARPLVRTLLFAVVVVLLIACANLAGLLLVRSIRRRREIAVRLALGARAATLLRQAIVESLVLSIAGGVVGLALAAVALRLGVSLLPETLPRIREIGLDWPVMAFALGLALLTGFLCGLAPAFAAIRTSVNETLKESGRTGTSGSGHARLRSALVVAEIAVALVLLTASGLLLRSFEKMRAVDMGSAPTIRLLRATFCPRSGMQTSRRSTNSVKTCCESCASCPVSKRSASLLCCPPPVMTSASLLRWMAIFLQRVLVSTWLRFRWCAAIRFRRLAYVYCVGVCSMSQTRQAHG